MMRNRKLEIICVFVLSIFIFISCKEDEDAVVAAFSASDTDVDAGETVSFTNESVNATYYQWNFGDGEVSVDENPTHSFTSGGEYDVQLIAIGDGGADSASVTINVTVSNLSIYEGVGIEGVDIYDSWSTVDAAYTSDTVHYIYDYTEDYGFYVHYVYYYNEGIVFAFYTETTELSDSDPVYFIILVSPYDGATAKAIELGSTVAQMENAYGDPEDKTTGSSYVGYWYDSLGIGFYTDSDSDEIDQIDIYEPTEVSSSTSSFTENRLNFQNSVMHQLNIDFIRNK